MSDVIRALISTITELEMCEEKYRAEADARGCDAGNPDGGSAWTCEHCQWIESATMISRTIAAARDALMADALERRTA